MSQLKLGVVLEAFGKPVRSALQAPSRLSVSGVQFNAVNALAPEQLTQTGRREFRTTLASFNLGLTALNCPLSSDLHDVERLPKRLILLKSVMQLAVDLGCRTLLLPLPKLPEGKDADTLRDAVTTLCHSADHLGVTIALEPGLDEGTTLIDYVHSFNSESLGFNFDPANFLFNGFDPLQTLIALGPKLAHVHARDGRANTISGIPSETAVGNGQLDWPMLIAMLESVEYRGFLTVNPESGGDLANKLTAGVEFLKQFLVPKITSPSR